MSLLTSNEPLKTLFGSCSPKYLLVRKVSIHTMLAYRRAVMEAWLHILQIMAIPIFYETLWILSVDILRLITGLYITNMNSFVYELICFLF